MASSDVEPDPAWAEIIYKLGSRFFRIRIRFRIQVKFCFKQKIQNIKKDKLKKIAFPQNLHDLHIDFSGRKFFDPWGQ